MQGQSDKTACKAGVSGRYHIITDSTGLQRLQLSSTVHNSANSMSYYRASAITVAIQYINNGAVSGGRGRQSGRFT